MECIKLRSWYNIDIQMTNHYVKVRYKQPVPYVRCGSHLIGGGKTVRMFNGDHTSMNRMVRNTLGSREGTYKFCLRWSHLANKMKRTPM